MRTPVLVIGRSGQLAQSLREAGARGGLPMFTLGRPELDLEGDTSIAEMLAELPPCVVVNAAAYTAVDAAEREPEKAFAVNRDGAARLARAARQAGAAFVHVSTDYVFDGRKSSAYVEDDAPGPLGIYGRSKLEGERAVLAAHPDAVVLRTAWVYSAFGGNFVKTMLRLAETHDVLRVVDDQRGAPTSAADLAAAILALAPRLADGSKAGGVYHAAAAGDTTWHGFAQAIFAGAARRGRKVPALQPIGTAEYPTAAMRPANSVLDCSKLAGTFGVTFPHWSQALEPCLDVLCGGKREQAA